VVHFAALPIMSDPEASFAAMELFRAKLCSRVGLPLVGVGVQLADPISTDAMATCSDFIWYDQVRVQCTTAVHEHHVTVTLLEPGSFSACAACSKRH
jgi:hypothetical protein